MDNFVYIFAFILALASSVLVMPYILMIADKYEIYDSNGERKIHTGKIPRLGGVAIGIAVVISLSLSQQAGYSLKGFTVGALLIFAVGFYDDLLRVNWKAKFIAQFLATTSTLLIMAPEIHRLHLFGFTLPLPQGIIYTALVLFIVMTMNSINLLDGLDGLASGVVLLIFIGYGVWGISRGFWEVVLISAAFGGSLVGFLRYNVYPAKIFLGDSGSLLLGFTVATIPLFQFQQGAGTTLDLSVPLLVLTVPLLDTVRVAMSRVIRRSNPFLPDKRHLHHLLLKHGLRHDMAVFTIYIITVAFISLGFFDRFLPRPLFLTIYFVLIITTLLIPNIAKMMREYQPVVSLYENITSKYPMIRPETLAQYGARPKVLRYGILGFLLTQFLLLDYGAILLYPVGFILAALILYFYYSSHQWGDSYVLILVMVGVLYFQTGEATGYSINQLTMMNSIHLANTTALFVSIFVVTCMLIADNEKLDAERILQPIDYLILVVLFLAMIVPLDIADLPLTRINVAKAAIVYLGVKSLFTYSVEGNKKIIITIIFMLAFTGVIGAIIAI